MLSTCICCNDSLRNGLISWHKICPSCGYEAANLQADINGSTTAQSLDENLRAEGLHLHRLKTFQVVFNTICKFADANANKLLDVGSAHGWFLEVASRRFHVSGIEPDLALYTASKESQPNLIFGYFPESINSECKYDIITFNDVFEHLPDPNNALAACRQHLNANGLLVLNLPTANGFFYNLSKILLKMGFGNFFDRMWQSGLPSPHLHYFKQENLVRLLEAHNYSLVSVSKLPTISFKGLYQRIAYTKSSMISCVTTWMAVALSLPVLRLFSSDIMLVIAKPEDY